MMYAIGDHVQYKHVHGPVRFICDQYLTIMVNNPDHKAQECRVIVFHRDWDDITHYGIK
jgi:hypothetical protein